MKNMIFELIDFDQVNLLFDGFYKSTGFEAAIIDLDGVVLSKSNWRNICTDFHRKHPETGKRCTESDTRLAGEIKRGEKYHFYKCLNGLIDVAVPIIINDDHVANLFTGQFFFEKPDRNFFIQQAKDYGFDQKKYLDALDLVPVVSEESVKPVLDFLLNMTMQISELSIQKDEQARLIGTLQESQKHLAVIFNSTTDFQLLVEPEPGGSFKILAANKPYMDKVNQLGISANENDLVGKSFKEVLSKVMFIDEETTENILKNYATVARTKQNLEYIEDLKINKKSYIAEISLTPVLNAEGNCQSILYNSHDITERIEAVRALKESDQRFTLATEGSTDILWDWPDVSADPMWLSPRFYEIMGYKEGLFKTTITEWERILHPDDKGKILIAMDKHLNEQVPYDVEYRLKNQRGLYKWFRARGRALWDEAGVVRRMSGSFQDITERKLEQKNLMLLNDALENSLNAFDIINSEGVFTYVNKSYVQMAGYESAEEIIGTSPVGHCLDPAQPEKIIHTIKTTGQFVDEFTAKRKDGSTYEVLMYARLAHDSEGNEIYPTTSIDITERKEAEAERERLILAIDQLSEAIIITDTNGNIEYVNPAFEKITGFTSNEALGENPRILKSDEHDDSFYQAMWETLAKGKVWRGRIVNKNKAGRLYTEEAVICPVLDKSGQIVEYVAVKRDITQELGLEAQLVQSQKMEAVGRLAGGVAHDFNNMLGVIHGYTEMSLEQVDPDQPIHDYLSAIENAAKRSADLTKQLLAFARKQTVAPRVLDLNQTVTDMTRMLQRMIGENIDLAWVPGEELWQVKIDPGQIDQILANLCVNARDAIVDVGKLTIETSNAILDDAYCVSHVGFLPGEYVRLAVSDNGCGMDSETLDKVFEPFFTTKELGKGTGLGLATVYGVVKQNNGFVNAYSEPELGTTFKIYLPRHLDPKQDQLPEQNLVTTTHRGNETVLLVEDEEAILTMTTMLLNREGYTVVAANTPGEAIRLGREFAGNINLLLSDVVMPEMNGRDLAKNILSLYPELKCVFMSGYTANVVAHHGVLDEGVNFLQKPFTRNELVVKLREVLDRE